MHQAITRANEDIEILEIQNNSQVINSLLIKTEIETTAENLFNELSSFIQVISAKTYETVYKNLTESWINVLGTIPDYTNKDLINKEIYDTINPWVENFRNSLFNYINTAFYDLSLDTKDYHQKGFLGDFFENVKNFFGKLWKNKRKSGYTCTKCRI